MQRIQGKHSWRCSCNFLWGRRVIVICTRSESEHHFRTSTFQTSLVPRTVTDNVSFSKSVPYLETRCNLLFFGFPIFSFVLIFVQRQRACQNSGILLPRFSLLPCPWGRVPGAEVRCTSRVFHEIWLCYFIFFNELYFIQSCLTFFMRNVVSGEKPVSDFLFLGNPVTRSKGPAFINQRVGSQM